MLWRGRNQRQVRHLASESKAVAARAPSRSASKARIYTDLTRLLRESRCSACGVGCPHSRNLIAGVHQAEATGGSSRPDFFIAERAQVKANRVFDFSFATYSKEP